MIKISVLVPICNVDAYLEQCLNSISGQTIKEVEIICIDDGSTDRSGEILDRCASTDSRIIVVHKKNTGYGHSMNLALERAKGEYVAVVESDDFAEPDMLEKLYSAAVKHDVEVVKANHYNHNKDKSRPYDRLNGYPKNQILNISNCPELLNIADTIWSCLYKREFLEDNHIRFHETPGASFQDISFSLQVWLNAQRVYFIQDAVLHYRNDNPGSSMYNPDKIFCVFDEYEWLDSLYSQRWSIDAKTEKCFTATKYRDYFNHYYRVAAQYQYAFLLRLHKSLENDIQKGRIAQEAFLPKVWANICDVNDNINPFFKKTSKSSSDPRLEHCEIKNNEVYLKAFFENLKCYPQTVIYGAGRVGQMIADVAVLNNVRIDCFAVTETEDENSEYKGIPIKSLNEVSRLADTCAVIIAVSEMSQYELYKNLETYNFQNIFRVDSLVRKFCYDYIQMKT